MSKSKLLQAAALSCAIVLAGCAGKGGTEEGDGALTEANGTESGGVSQSVDASDVVVDQSAGQQDSDEVQRPYAYVLYFDFDNAGVKEDFRGLLDKHAAYLAANPDVKVILEGHADERGTREYNLALGERRAYAVAAYLKLKGVASDQISIVSFGEEKPVDTAHTDAAYSQNRRVEIKYQN